nr:unnamed protein product [Spirometra erinaceieuropaei]
MHRQNVITDKDNGDWNVHFRLISRRQAVIPNLEVWNTWGSIPRPVDQKSSTSNYRDTGSSRRLRSGTYNGTKKCPKQILENHAVCGLTVVTDVKLTIETTKIETTHSLFLPCSCSSCSPSFSSFQPPTRQTDRVSPLTLSAWNVRSLLDNPMSSRPERRTALVARELVRYKVDMASLSEIPFSEQGQLEDVGAGCTFLCSGCFKAERRDAGVSFSIRNDIVGPLPRLLQGINDRLMKLRLSLRAGKFVTIINDWFDDDAAISNLLAEKNRLHKAFVDHLTDDNKTAFCRSRRPVQQRLREMQDAWTACKAEEIQGYADCNEWKNLFSAIKAVYGPPVKGTAPLLSADGSTLLIEKTQILQRRLRPQHDLRRGHAKEHGLFSAACGNFGLVINTEKTVVMHQPPPNSATAPNASPQISVNGTQLQVVDNFMYLCGTLFRSIKIDDEVALWISKTSQTLSLIQNIIWHRHGLQLSTKMKMYKAVILPTLMYRTDTWTVYKKQVLRLSHLHLSCLLRILKLRWQDRIPDTDVLEQTGILSIYAVLRQPQLRWSGHLVRMDNEGLPKRLFYGDVTTGSRRQGGQIRRYKDILKTSLRRLQKNPANWKDIARVRPTWGRTVKTGGGICEANRIAAAKVKLKARKSRLRRPLDANTQSP